MAEGVIFLPYRTHAGVFQSTCLACEHPILARSEDALTRAAMSHARYIHQQKDPQQDVHSEDERLDALARA